jgi:uncharacterized protein (DUF433 family)
MEAVVVEARPIQATMSFFDIAKSYNYHIIKTEGVRSGKPRIAGRRITVADIAIWNIEQQMTVAEIAQEYDLAPAQIYAALAYYYDNKIEIDMQIAEADRVWQAGYDAQYSQEQAAIKAMAWSHPSK